MQWGGLSTLKLSILNKAQFEYVKSYATPYDNTIVLPLNYMQSLGNVVAPLEFNQSNAHTHTHCGKKEA